MLPAVPTLKLKPVLQERIAAKMRQKLPQSAALVDGVAASPSTLNQGSSQDLGGGASGSTDDAPSSAAAPVGSRQWQSHSASDHDLSRAVFGGSHTTDSTAAAPQSHTTDSTAAAPQSHIAAFASDAVADHMTNKEPGSARTKEAGAGSVPLSLLEFRRLTAGGLPNPATRAFVVTGRGLAGPIRVTQITQVQGFKREAVITLRLTRAEQDGVYGTYVRLEDRQSAGLL